jgi:hypothetical protein
MRTKKIELDVDFIGLQDSTLTKDEEKAISEFIRKNKLKKKKSTTRKKITA